MNFESISENILKFMGYSPIFELGQKQRYQYFHLLSPKLSDLNSVFVSYRNTYASLISKLEKIEEVMGTISEFQTSLRKCDFFGITSGFKQAINQYLSIFDSMVITPLNAFSQHFSELESLYEVYHEKKELYKDAIDKYVSDGPSSKQYPQKVSALVDTHKYLTTTFVNLYNKMEEISTNLKNLTPSLLVGFVNSYRKQQEYINGIINDNTAVFQTESELLKDGEMITPDSLEMNMKQNEISQSLSNAVNAVLPYYWSRIDAQFTGTSKQTIQGFLYKKNKKFNTWKKRFVSVGNGNLNYGGNVDKYLKNPSTIDLLLVSVKVEPDAPRPYCFSLQTRDEQIIFQTLSNYDASLWVAVIEANIIMRMNGGNAKPQEKHTCADCGAVDATWITLNWGQYICSRCSGIHRSLGPSHSRVRSPTLDSIPKYQLETFEKINEIPDSNKILEKNAGDKKIDSSVSVEDRESFIQQKYVTLLYSAQTNDDIMNAIEKKDINTVYKCICAGNHRRFNGFLPIHEAAIAGDPHILCLLGMHSDIVDIPDESGWTPLTYAVFYGNVECVKVLQELGSSPSSSKAVPLWLAAFSGGNEEMMKLYPIEEGKDPASVSKIIPPHGPASLKRRTRKKFVTTLDDDSYSPQPSPQASPKIGHNNFSRMAHGPREKIKRQKSSQEDLSTSNHSERRRPRRTQSSRNDDLEQIPMVLSKQSLLENMSSGSLDIPTPKPKVNKTPRKHKVDVIITRHNSDDEKADSNTSIHPVRMSRKKQQTSVPQQPKPIV